jgi:hypothetical protein
MTEKVGTSVGNGVGGVVGSDVGIGGVTSTEGIAVGVKAA